MNIADILKLKSGEIYSIPEKSKICDAIDLLNEKKIGALIVKDDNGLVAGIITERDILSKACPRKFDVNDLSVTDLMTPRDELIIGTASDSVSYVMNVMTKKKIRHIPIFDDEKLVGIVSIGDVIKTIMDQSEAEVRLLKEHIQNPYGINIP